MARPKWVYLTVLLFLGLGLSSAGRVTVVDNDKAEKFVLGGHIGWNPGYIGGIIEGALGYKSDQATPTPPPSPDETSIAGTTEEGYIGGQGGGYGSGQGGGYGSGQVGDINWGGGGGGGGGFGRGRGGGWGGGGGSWGVRGGGSEQDRHQGGDGWGDQSGCDGDCGDQSGGDSSGQGGSPSTEVPGFTIPGFDIGGVIGGEIGISGGLYCTPINCRDKNNCRGVRLHFETSNDPRMAGSNGQKQNMNHGVEDKHSLHTLAATPASAPLSVAAEPVDPLKQELSMVLKPSPVPLCVAAEPEPVDPLNQELSMVPKPSPVSD